MPTAMKRKGSPSLTDVEESSKRRFAESDPVVTPTDNDQNEDENTEDTPSTAQPIHLSTTASSSTDVLPTTTAAAPASSSTGAVSNPDDPTDRRARFAALRARNAAGRKSNLSATKTEAQRRATPAAELASLTRKREHAAHKLLQADTAAQGQDFERKRAWDWTVEESERWDARVAAKRANAAENRFRTYAGEAEKVYERQVGGIGKDAAGWAERVAEYGAAKRAAIEKAVAGGGLEVVELPDGEMIAVDRDGSFVSTAGGGDAAAGFTAAGSRPSKEAVDRLVADIRKAEEVRARKRKERGRADEDGGDVTYINEKNKQFNLKLARFYDKYTADIRESFERGTAI